MSPSDRFRTVVLVVLLFAQGSAARAAPPEPPSAPRPIEVPPALRARMATIEPSGIVWAASLDRYLVISDDTGDEGHRHLPWALAMSRDGVFDQEPIVVHGVHRFNDGEAICAGPDGLFFLTTSHSPNLRGRTKRQRRMLMLLRLEGRLLRVIGRVDLTSARAPDGGSFRDIVGLDVDGRLDIEAVSYRDGALLIGLKSPLTADGRALVLRLERPVEALLSRVIVPGALTRLWQLPLDGGAGARGVRQGISDLAGLPDGALVIAANSPKGMPSDGGGALYRYQPGAPNPVLMRRFPGLKPEGVTVGEGGKALIIVFDGDRGQPLWMRWPLPLGRGRS